MNRTAWNLLTTSAIVTGILTGCSSSNTGTPAATQSTNSSSTNSTSTNSTNSTNTEATSNSTTNNTTHTVTAPTNIPAATNAPTPPTATPPASQNSAAAPAPAATTQPAAPSASSATPKTPAPAGKNYAIQLNNYAFNPATMTIESGSSITFTNDDADDHTVTAVNGSFDSGDLPQGKTFTHTFTQPGTYSLTCKFHPT